MFLVGWGIILLHGFDIQKRATSLIPAVILYPPPIEPGGTRARSPSPEHPFFRVFSGNLPETIRPKYTPFPEKMGIRMRPPHAFEWGGGGDSV